MGANNKRISPIHGPERRRDSPPLTKREVDEIIDNPFSTSYTYANADPNGTYTIPRLGRRFPEPDTSWWTTTSLPSSKLPWFCCAVLFAALLVLVNAVHNQSCPHEQEKKTAIIGIAENTGADHLQLGSATENADLQPVLEPGEVQKAMIPMPLPPYEMCQHVPLSAIAFEVDDDVDDLLTNSMEDGHYSNRSHENVETTTTNSSTAVDFPLSSSSPSEFESNFEGSNTTGKLELGFLPAQAKLGPWGKELDVKFKYKVPYLKFQFNLTTALWFGDF